MAETSSKEQPLSENSARDRKITGLQSSQSRPVHHESIPHSQARRDILEGKALYQAIVENFEGFVYVCDADYRLVYLNPQCRKPAGGNAVGALCYQALHRRRTPCPFCVREQVMQGQTVRFEMLHDMDRRWYLSVNTPIRRLGAAPCMLVVVTDIDARKKAEAALQTADRPTHGSDCFRRTASVERHKFGPIVGKSPAMQLVYEQILRAAATAATVIIYGEPGTGKELVARAIHDMSERRDNRFVPVHCGAIPENLVESEFFGYMKGAFSGADADKPGYVDFADGGTLFLDEVGEIRLDMQVKLLRVIEGGGYTPVGSSQVKTSRIRIISATNRDLGERIAKGLFREDFFYRIHILPIHLPPLRERKEDLPLLIGHFMELFSGKQNPPPLTTRMIEKIMDYDWPGNVRELQNAIIRFCSLHVLELGAMTPSNISPPGAPSLRLPSPEGKTLNAMMADFEKQIIAQTLAQHHWHRSRAAVQLGIDRKTLFSKIKRYQLG
jgi:transcriptional regulator with PAS, ATPase and Fis domain